MSAEVEVRTLADAKQVLREQVVNEIIKETEDAIRIADKNLGNMTFLERCSYKLIREASMDLLGYLRGW